jgi:hypothetical protein
MFQHNNPGRVPFRALIAVAVTGGALFAFARHTQPHALPSIHLACTLPIDVLWPTAAFNAVALMLTAAALKFFGRGG